MEPLDELDVVAFVDNMILRMMPGGSNKRISLFRWFGGKGVIAKWVLQHLPRKGVKIYVEPYAGSASVLLSNTKPYPIEVLNDLDDRIITLYRVLQDKDKFEEIAHRLIWTPVSRSEFVRAIEILANKDKYNDVDYAWAFFVQQNQRFGGDAEEATIGNWGRSKTSITRSESKQTASWWSRVKALHSFHTRLSRVQIDSVDAIECIKSWDSSETLFYVDPPYVASTRKDHKYKVEVDDLHHVRLIDTLLNVKGKVALSGYDNRLYKKLTDRGWYKDKRMIRAFSIHPQFRDGVTDARVEVLWMNYNPSEAL